VLWLCRRAEDHDEKRKDFEFKVAFLKKVPLLMNHLPRSELPKMANSLTSRVWRPGQTLVSQGDTGKALYLIQSGVALVYVREAASRPPELRCTLKSGDYFGGHTLLTSRPNIATIVAGQSEEGDLVTLSMSRGVFEESGLKRWLHFPKRPALYQGRGENESGAAKAAKATKKSPLEERVIRKALLENANLRAFVKLEPEQMDGLVQSAERREVGAGTVIAKRGEAANELIIVCSGEVEVVLSENNEKATSSTASVFDADFSLEAKMGKRGMAERMIRKQQFLHKLSCSDPPKARASALAGGCTKDIGRPLGQPRSAPKFLPKLRQTEVSPASAALLSPAPEPAARLRSSTTDEDPSQALPKRPKQPRQGRLSVGEMSAAPRPLMPLPERRVAPPNRSLTMSTTGAADLSVLRTVSTSSAVEGRQAVESQFTRACSVRFQRTESIGEEGEAAVLGAGDSFGELAVLYQLRREATFRALQDCVVFAISRAAFMKWCQSSSQDRKIKDYVKILDEVNTLQCLLSTERYELACHVHSVQTFKPGERILQQGTERTRNLWYVVSAGEAEQYMWKDGPDGKKVKVWLADLRHGHHFGERALMRGDPITQSNVETRECGMTCLVFEYAGIAKILKKVFSGDDLPSPDCPIQEWCQRLADGWKANAGSIGVKRRGQTVQFKNLRKKCALGRGGFCKVTLVEDVSDGRRYALKTMSKGHLSQAGAERQIRWERELLSIADSPFIISLEKTFVDEQYLYFLLEACLGGSLADVLVERPEIFREDTPRGSSTAFYVGCVALALEHLHTRSIAHRDVKTENVLLEESGYAKLCDMGFARYVLGKTSTLAGTPDYMAPEMIDFPHHHDHSVDWWALGVLTFELLSGDTPFDDEGITEPRGRLLAIRRSQESGKLTFPFDFPHASKGFVNALLRKLPGRLGAGEGGASNLKEHSMFRACKLDWTQFEARRLPAPFTKKWSDKVAEESRIDSAEMNVDLYGCMDNNVGVDSSNDLGFDPGDSLYVPWSPSGNDAAAVEWARMTS